MLRGNALAKIDDKGRIKLPAAFRSVIEPEYGNEFFVTSIRGDSVLLYPLRVYADIERRLIESSKVEPLVSRLRSAVSFYGQSTVMDQQGRILIHQLLREAADVNGEVAVLGQQDFLEIWNRTTFEERLRTNPLSDTELAELATLGF